MWVERERDPQASFHCGDETSAFFLCLEKLLAPMARESVYNGEKKHKSYLC